MPGRRVKGFTLLELVITLAVTAIMAAGVAWSFGSVERVTLQQASQQLQGDFRYTQRMAMIEGRRWGILFDVNGNRYHLVTVTDGSREPTQIEKTVPLSGGVRLVETSAPFLLYLPRGTPSAGFRVTLAKGDYWQRLTATVSGGRIAIKDMVLTQNGEIPIDDTDQ